MRGIPKIIQTQDDLQNLVALAQAGEVDKTELTEKINALLNMQYFHTPIIAINGSVVTTRYFSEVAVGDATIDNLTVTAVSHTEPATDGSGTDENGNPVYSETEITLSEPPASGQTMLSIYMTNNHLTANGFDVTAINNILEVL